MNRRLEKLSLLVAATSYFLLAFADPAWAQTAPQTPLFNPQTEYVAGSKNGPSGIAVGDFNGDGKLDLAVVNFGDWNIYVLLGNGDGTFQAARSVYFASGGGLLRYVVTADFNGDGKLDLAVSNYGDNSFSVLLGNGDGTFQPPRTLPIGTHPALVAVGDFNGDGKPDLAISSVGDNTVSVLLGNGDGTFLAPQVTPVGLNPWYFAVGDFNGDGKLDLAVADYGCPLDCTSSPSNTVTVLLGNGNGTFLPGPSLTVGNGPAGVVVGDFNGDGKPDLAVANLNENTLSVLLGNGDGTFQAPHTFADPGMTHPYFLAIGDFNRDGKQDLVVTNHLFATVSVLLGNGDGTFQAAQDFAVDNDPVYVTVNDFNGDAAPDLAVANLHAIAISVLLGNAGTGSTVVATPTFSPGGGTYTGSVTVSISDATSGATIHYTIDGSTPTTSSAVYTGALTFTQTTTLKAMAAASGMTNSGVASATYTVQQQVATPTFSPGGGTYTGSVTVSINDASSGATIYYTTNGSTPTTSSVVYTGALTFTQTTTLKAMAAASGMTNSGVASATYTVQQPSLTSLTLNPSTVVGGPMGSSTGTVTLSGPAPSGGAVIALSSSNASVASVPASVTVPAGANSASFTVTTTAVSTSTSVTISASYGGTTLRASLTVNPAPVPPSITSQPASQTVAAGQTATFSVTASGTAPLSYQWSKNGTPISGANSSSYATPPTSTSDNGAQFVVVVSNAAGSATSNPATLTVTPPTLTSLT